METSKILIADDAKINRKMLTIIFKEKYDIYEAEDGQRAIDIIDQNQDISLLLLDLNMPKKTGFDVLDYLCEHNLIGQIPVIIITASRETDDEIQAFNRGAAEIIHKPFIPEIVLRRAENLIELYASRRRLVKQLEERTAELQESKKYDSVTGLFTKNQFYDYAEELLGQSEKSGEPEHYCFLYFNIRQFKYYNAEFGLHEGNLILQKLAAVLRQHAPEEAIARFDNDHFVILTKNRNYRTLAQIIQEDFNETVSVYGMKLKTGIYCTKKSGEDIARACDMAKAACDYIRSSSLSVYEYDEEIHKSIEMEAYIIQHLDEAIQKGYIQVYYQPVIRTINGALCSMEALVRWMDPVYGLLSPAEFIPLLENNQLITKLDIYVVEEICRTMRWKRDEGYLNVPVSVNFSRMDFLSCDIFSEVERIVHQYGIARDMIYIEITESMVIEDPNIFKTEIRRFREAGYQIWMDDFGSGYSSLNVLREYEFDEIKLDIKFLQIFDERTRQVIRSVVSMAKELRVVTLAEGVETQEQYDFLCDIGCEKVQGFLFSPPISAEQLIEMYSGREDEIETRLWHKYYAKAGEVNFITDQPLIIVDYDGIDFRYLYVNKAYRFVWESMGIRNEEDAYTLANIKHSPLWQQYRTFFDSLEVNGDFKSLEYSYSGNYMRLRARIICREQDHSLLQGELINLTRSQDEEYIQKRDYVSRMMHGMYDSVYVFGLDGSYAETIIPGPNQSKLVGAKSGDGKLPDIHTVAELIIHRDDREEFEQFIDFTTAEQRIAEQGRGYITEMFRTKIANGAYIWKLHTIQFLPLTSQIIYSSRCVPHLQQQILNKFTNGHLGSREDTIQNQLWKTLMDSEFIQVFWKDKNRRFLGANARFLDTYGFKDVSEIIGKTDEDMHWHIDNEPFRNDEWKVLNKGESIISRVGKCIIKGVVHNVLAVKEPIYQDGEVVGLAGTFINLDMLTEYLGLESFTETKDDLTGLLSAQGVTNTAAEYAEGWEFRKEKFAVITLNFDFYERAEQTYGDLAARKILLKASELISSLASNRGSVGRVYGSNFVLFMKYIDKAVVTQLSGKIIEACDHIHELAGYDVTLHPTVRIFYAEDCQNIKKMIATASHGYHVNIRPQKRLEEKLRESQLKMDVVIDAIPGGIALYEVVDHDMRMVYASEGLCRTLGRSVEELKAVTVLGSGYNVVPQDQEILWKATRSAIEEGVFPNISIRSIHGDGHLVWLKIQGRMIGEQDGHPLFMYVYQNMSEPLEAFEKVIQADVEGFVIRDINTGDILLCNPAITMIAQNIFHTSVNELMERIVRETSGDMVHDMKYNDRYFRVNVIRDKWYDRATEICFMIDMTAQYEEQERSKEILAHVPAAIAVFAVSPDTGEISRIFLSDQAKTYTHVADSGEDTLEELVSVVHPLDREYVRNATLKSFREKALMDIKFRCIGNDGKVYWNRLMTQPYSQPDGRYLFYGVYTDITELKEQEEKLEKLSHTDALTGLKNRHALREDFEILQGKTIVMAVLDIDHFKEFNDAFGHEAGDRVICACATEIQKEFTDSNCYRYGGDEFLIIREDGDQSRMNLQLERLIRTVKEKKPDSSLPEITLSYGCLGGTPETNQELRELFRDSDQLLYQNKHTKKVQFIEKQEKTE